MSEYIYNLDAVFWLTLATLIIGGGGACLRYLFKSKCSKVSCCCFSIERDVLAEIQELNLELSRLPSRNISRVPSLDINV